MSRRAAEPQRRKRSHRLQENEISGDIINTTLQIHKALGPELPGSIYERVLANELTRREHQMERQVPISIHDENLVFEMGLKAELLVNGLVVFELKSV